MLCRKTKLECRIHITAPCHASCPCTHNSTDTHYVQYSRNRTALHIAILQTCLNAYTNAQNHHFTPEKVIGPKWDMKPSPSPRKDPSLLSDPARTSRLRDGLLDLRNSLPHPSTKHSPQASALQHGPILATRSRTKIGTTKSQPTLLLLPPVVLHSGP